LTSTVAVALLQKLQTPTVGTIAGALLILLGGIIYVSGSPTGGTFFALAGFGLILKYRVLPARRERHK
jgi:multisubunit Na+/H+ antiporter MnhG subunit